MGVIAAIARRMMLRGGAEGLVTAGTGLVNALRPDATRQMELGHSAFLASQDALEAEYRHARAGWFDRFVNGLNRLPRPMLALGTLGLFVYAMAEPVGFAARMQGLAHVPEPLWWLLGAIVAFYFGARETHYLREHRPVGPAHDPLPAPPPTNPALLDWRRTRVPDDGADDGR